MICAGRTKQSSPHTFSHPLFFSKKQEHSQTYITVHSSYFLVSRKTRNMQAMQHKETAGTGPTRQLVQHNRFKWHLLSYLCGSQAQDDSAFHLAGCVAYKYNRFLFPFWLLYFQCADTVLTLWFHWDCYTWDASRGGLPDCNCTCNTTKSGWWIIPPGGTLSTGGNPHALAEGIPLGMGKDWVIWLKYC